MSLDQIVPTIFLILVLILILPRFLRSNSNTKLFLKNLFFWSVIVGLVMIVLNLILK